MTTKPNDNRAPIRLPASLMARVAVVATRDGVSVTTTVCRLVGQALDAAEARTIPVAAGVEYTETREVGSRVTSYEEQQP